MTQAILSMLEKHPFVADFEPRHVARLATLAKEIRYEPNHVIFREGEEGREFYLILSGRVALEIEAPKHVLRVQSLFGGDAFGWSAVLTGKGKHLQARALDAVQTLAFDGQELLAALKDDTALGLAFTLQLLRVVSERFEATRLQLLDMHSPVAKLAGN